MGCIFYLSKIFEVDEKYRRKNSKEQPPISLYIESLMTSMISELLFQKIIFIQTYV